MTTQNNIQHLTRLITRLRLRIKGQRLSAGILLILSLTALYVSIFSVCDYFLYFSVHGRLIWRAGLITLTALLIVLLIVRLFQHVTDRELAGAIQRTYPDLSDSILTTLELSHIPQDKLTGFGRLLTRSQQISTEQRITRVRLKKVQPATVLYPYFICAFIAAVLITTLWIFPGAPIRTSLPRLLLLTPAEMFLEEVSPGTSSVWYGEPLSITAKTRVHIAPTIKYRFQNQSWHHIRMNPATKNNLFQYRFERITEPLDYRIEVRDGFSPVYHISVITHPGVGDISVTYHYPAYTGWPPRTDPNTSGDIEAIAGTRALIQAHVSKPVKNAEIITDDDRKIGLRITKQTEVAGELVLTKQGHYWISVTDTEGLSNSEPAHHRITVTEDRAPAVRVISPASDVTVRENSTIKLVCELSDDFGVSALEIVWRLAGVEKENILPVARFSSPPDLKVVDYEWDIAETGAAPADTISYYLRVKDNNTVTGPRTGVSETYYIHIFSYQEEHRELEQAMEEFQKNLIDLLAKQIEARQEVRAASETPEKHLPELTRAATIQSEIFNKASKLADNLDSIIPRLKSDPLSTRWFAEEVERLAQNLNYLSGQKLQPVSNKLSKSLASPGTADLPEIEKEQSDIISELEKMSLLTEDLLKSQRMNDILAGARDALDFNDDFMRSLENARGTTDPQKLAELKKTLQKISDMMYELARALKDMPHELPEDFINKPAIKNLDMSKMQSSISEMQKALAQGDIGAALAQAQNFYRALSELMETLQGAANEVFSPQAQSMASRSEEYARRLEEIVSKQEELLQTTRKIDEHRLKRVMEKQKQILKELTERQKQITEHTKKYWAESQQLTPLRERPHFHRARYEMPKTIKNMEDVLGEMQSGALHQSPKYLGEIIQLLDQLQHATTEFVTSQVSDNEEKLWEFAQDSKWAEWLGELKDGEQKILDTLQKQHVYDQQYFQPSDLKQLGGTAESQKGLSQETQSLKNDLEKLSRYTSAIGPDLLDNFSTAQTEMSDASQSLSSRITTDAIGHQEKALEALLQGKDKMSQIMPMLAQMPASGSLPIASFVQPAGGNLPGGRMGYLEGQVRIPKPEDLELSPDFRRQVLEGLKQRYPDAYRHLIEEYYKRLTQ